MDKGEENEVGYGTVAGSCGEESKQLTGCGRTDDGKGRRGEEKVYGWRKTCGTILLGEG